MIRRENAECAVEVLKPYDQNPRTHSPAQIEQLKKSIAEFGFTNPLLIDEENLILAGHGRLEAAKASGIKTVPCVRLLGLSPAQKKALVIADNQLALNAGWNEAVLASEIRLLAGEGFDMKLLGFDDERLVQLGGNIGGIGFPSLDAGEKKPFQQITFTLHDSQADLIKAALDTAKAQGGGESAVNENSNGNALAFIVEAWAQKKDAQRGGGE